MMHRTYSRCRLRTYERPRATRRPTLPPLNGRDAFTSEYIEWFRLLDPIVARGITSAPAEAFEQRPSSGFDPRLLPGR